MRVGLVPLLAVSLIAASAFGQGSQQPEVDVPRPASDATSAPTSAESMVAPPPALEPWKLHGYYRLTAAARLNPLGLFLGGTVLGRMRMYASDSAALKDNYIGFGPVLLLSPANMRVGAGLEVQPLSILQLSTSYELFAHFGSFEYLQSYPSPTYGTSDRDLRALKDARQNYAGIGGVFTLAALLQLKVGPIAVRSNLRAFYYTMRLRAGDRVWYDSILDVMSPNHGWVLTKDTDLLYVTNFGLAAGVRYTMTHSFFGAEHYEPGETPQPVLNSPTHRLGPFIAYTFFDRGERAAVNAPTLVLIVQWYMRHRYRAGQVSSAGLPQLALAFTVKGVI